MDDKSSGGIRLDLESAFHLVVTDRDIRGTRDDRDGSCQVASVARLKHPDDQNIASN